MEKRAEAAETALATAHRQACMFIDPDSGECEWPDCTEEVHKAMEDPKWS